MFLALLAGVTLWLILSKAQVDDIIKAIKSANPWFLGAGLGAVLVYIAAEGLTYKTSLKELGANISYRKAFVYACTDLYFCAITPSASGGQPATSYYMAKDNISVAASTASILLFLLQYKLVLLTYIALVLIISPDILILQPFAFHCLFLLSLIINLSLITFIILSFKKPVIVEKIINLLARLLIKLRLSKKAEKTKEKFSKVGREFHGMAAMYRGKRGLFFKTFGLCFVQRTALFIIVWFVYLAFGGRSISVFDVIAYQVILSSSVDILPLPGAAGVTEISFLKIFRRVFPHKLIVPAMLLTRFFNYYLCMFICGLVTLANIIRLKMVKTAKNKSE